MSKATQKMQRDQQQAPAPMRDSYLVQRLSKPYGRTLLGVDNPFAFGGGYRNGGLSDDAMSLLRGIFEFDYMGAAEYEFGAVPEALNGIARDAADLTAVTIDVDLVKVPASWRDKTNTKLTGTAPIYVLCRRAQAHEIRARVILWARTERTDLRDPLNLTSTLRPVDEYDGRVTGWLELNNGFLFFTDRPMWEQTCALFGVEV